VLTSFAANTVCNNYHLSRFIEQTSALTGRFFVSACLCFCPGVGLAADDALEKYALETSCSTNKYNDTVTVKHVIDGDTIILTDERRVRLIGINTPETGREGRPDQIGADQAQDYLSRLLHTNAEIKLVYDKEHTDKYGRTLAHLFLKDGINIQAILLKRGLATPLAIPPNLAHVDCYEKSAEFAQSQQIGLWALKQYQPVPVESITIRDLGYRIITGNVLRIGESKSSIWINLARNLALRITKEDQPYFQDSNLKDLVGKEIIARGWLYYSHGELRMRIRHPVDLNIRQANGKP
jgi:endonuclease YncB( thermonuclease family)